MLHLQVDALKLEPFVDSFIRALGLNRAYTMLVLNPKWSASLPAYGYRIGFSEYELRMMNENVSGHLASCAESFPRYQLAAAVHAASSSTLSCFCCSHGTAAVSSYTVVTPAAAPCMHVLDSFADHMHKLHLSTKAATVTALTPLGCKCLSTVQAATPELHPGTAAAGQV